MRKFLLIITLLLMTSGLSLAQDEGFTHYEIASQWIEKAERSRVFELDLKFLELDMIPPEIGNLNDLVFLELSVNNLINIPPEIGQLTNLYNLDLYYNKISTLPPEIGQLNKLHKLNLAANHLRQLPSELGQLTKLQKLWVGSNQLTDIPPEIGNLKNLCQLDLSNNYLQHLPSELGQLTKLAEDGCDLQLDGNPLISPPPEVIAQGTPAILDYLRNQAGWHLQRVIVSGATGFGLLAVLILAIRWRMRHMRRKSKPKNDPI